MSLAAKRASPYPGAMESHERLSFALQDGASLGRQSVRVRRVADITLPSGRVVACDPLVRHSTKAFLHRFPQGTFPVVLTERLVDGERIRQNGVAATIVFEPQGAPRRWEPAMTRLRRAEEPGVEGYAVDAGKGCFVDVSALEAFEQQDTADRILASPDERSFLLDRATRANVVVFGSGSGDGVYASFVGRDAEGRIVCLTTDFDLDELDCIRWGGPWWDDGDDEGDPIFSLLALTDFLAEYGAPSASWLARYPIDREIQSMWSAERSGYVLLSVLRRLAHPRLADALACELSEVRALVARFGVTGHDRALAELAERCRSEIEGQREIGEAIFELRYEVRDAVLASMPVDADARFMAAVRGESYDDPRAPLRAFERDSERRLAEAIVTLVPEGPSFEDLVRAHASTTPSREARRAKPVL